MRTLLLGRNVNIRYLASNFFIKIITMLKLVLDKSYHIQWNFAFLAKNCENRWIIWSFPVPRFYQKVSNRQLIRIILMRCEGYNSPHTWSGRCMARCRGGGGGGRPGWPARSWRRSPGRAGCTRERSSSRWWENFRRYPNKILSVSQVWTLSWSWLSQRLHYMFWNIFGIKKWVWILWRLFLYIY